MSKTPMNFAQILRSLKAPTATILALLAFSTTAYAADAKPTAKEIAKARAECAMQKQKVRALENANADEAKLTPALAEWEHACGHAQDLISAASGIPAPKPEPDPNAAPAPQQQ